MSLVQKYGITKETAGAVLGSIRAEGTWKKITFSKADLEALESEIYELNWSRPRMEIAPFTDVDFSAAAYDDASLAAFYLYKVQSSRERGIDFTLTLSDVRKIVSKKRCYFSGQAIVNGKESPNRMTLDRLDNKIGYTKENTVACAYWVNQLKGELFENPRSKLFTDVKTLLKIINKIAK